MRGGVTSCSKIYRSFRMYTKCAKRYTKRNK